MSASNNEMGNNPARPDAEKLLDQVFLEARSKLIDLAAILDRLQRYGGVDDYRLRAFYEALEELRKDRNPDRARRVLLRFSDPTSDPVEKPLTPAATGAWPGERSKSKT
jgi:hypothetical protein